MQTLTPEMVAAARKSLQECLAKSVIPKEYWDEITHWLEATHMENIYLEGREAIGAWFQRSSQNGLCHQFCQGRLYAEQLVPGRGELGYGTSTG